MRELTWWRRRRPAALTHRERDDLHARLIAMTPETVDDAMPVLLRAAAGESGESAFRVGLLLLRDEPATRFLWDLTASWFFLCVNGPAVLRERANDAARILVDLHLREATRLRRFEKDVPGSRVAVARHLINAQRNRRMRGDWLHLYRDDLRTALQAGSPETQTAEAEDQPAADAAQPVSDTPAQRVILADALPGPQRHEDRRLIEAYKPLLGDVPLAGDPTALPLLADQLESAFPWLPEFTSYIRDELAVRCYAGLTWLHLPPVVLVGPPGCGKTLIARRLADLAGVGSDILSLGGSSDARHLLGTARGWSSAQPCGPLVAIKRHGCANPVVVLDELEKAGGSSQGGRVHDALLALLEPVSARRYYDEALNVACDLGAVTWIATANDADLLPATLKSRLTVVRTPAPDGRYLDTILGQLRRDLADDLAMRPDALPTLSAESHAALRADLEAYGDVRRVARGYRRAIAAGIAQRRRPVDA